RISSRTIRRSMSGASPIAAAPGTRSRARAAPRAGAMIGVPGAVGAGRSRHPTAARSPSGRRPDAKVDRVTRLALVRPAAAAREAESEVDADRAYRRLVAEAEAGRGPHGAEVENPDA